MPDIDTRSTFNALLASSIHDMKNSLGMVINTLDQLVEDTDKPLNLKKIPLLQFEARRINENLIQLLALYKSENNLLATYIDEHNIAEFLDELIVQDTKIAEAKGITISVECDDELSGYFDRDLITGVLRNAMHNAIRHTKNTIQIIADNDEDKSLVIQLLDNGPGFNEVLLTNNSTAIDTIDYMNGRTGLGLHFCAISAKLHKNRDKQGHVSIANRKGQSGAMFTLYLP